MVYRKENRVVLKNTAVYVVSRDYLGGKLLVVYNPYVDVAKREGLYDRGGLDCDGVFFGFSLLFHNTVLGVGEVVREYFDKDVVERSFKMLKGVFVCVLFVFGWGRMFWLMLRFVMVLMRFCLFCSLGFQSWVFRWLRLWRCCDLVIGWS
ncbi:MAG: hypothetical protein LBE76_06020 [Nitrososphaerota archaeon]|nr:hypothetical protein [Nitrososphaerota archaeon]